MDSKKISGWLQASRNENHKNVEKTETYEDRVVVDKLELSKTMKEIIDNAIFEMERIYGTCPDKNFGDALVSLNGAKRSLLKAQDLN